jgi:adenosylhomocysteine nucleosidase
METIGLIAAMPMESRALLQLVRGQERVSIGSLRGVRFRSADHDCVLVTSGMGVRRAATATRALIAAVQPDCLLSFGIAGTVQQDLKIGDTILAVQNCSLEMGELSPFQPLAALSAESQRSVEQALGSLGTRFVQGTAVTTRGSQLVLQRSQGLHNPVLEMETAGILQVAAENKIPLIVLRSVSDDPCSPIPFDLETVMDDEYNFRPGRLLLQILKRPGILFRSRQMITNSRLAADNAAAAVWAVLSQPGALYQANAIGRSL